MMIRLLVALSAILSAAPAPAINFIWDGQLDTVWNTVAGAPPNALTNWTPDAGLLAPIPDADDAIFFTGASPGNVILNGNRTVQSVTFATSENYVLAGNTLTLSTGGLIATGGGDQVIVSDVDLGAEATWSIGDGSIVSISGAIDDPGGPFTLTKEGGGVLALLSNNDHDGFVVNGGTLLINNASRLGSAGAGVTIANGASLAAFGTFSAGPNRQMTLPSGQATLATGVNDVGWEGLISGDGTLVKTGSGQLSLFNASNSQAGVLVEEGTLGISDDGQLGDANFALTLKNGSELHASNTIDSPASRGLVLEGGGAIDAPLGTVTWNGAVSGDGGLTKRGDGKLTLSGANTFSGGLLIESGDLRLADSTAAGTGTITNESSGAVLEYADGVTIANTVDLKQDAILNIPTGTAEHSGAISTPTSGVLTKAGPGTLVVSSSNNFVGTSGGFNVQEGTVVIAADNALGNIGNGTIVAGAALEFADGVTSEATLFALGSTELRVPGGTATLAGGIAGTMPIEKTGAGTLRFDTIGDNTNPALMTVSAGQLVLAAQGGDNVGGDLTVAGGAVVTLQDGPLGSLNLDTGLTLQPGAILNIQGGSVGSGLVADADSTINISGGSVGGGLKGIAGSVINISGGEVLGPIIATSGEINISGGRSGNASVISGDVTGEISGGVFGRNVDFIPDTDSGGSLTLMGDQFQLDGVPVDTGVPFTLPFSGTFSGVLADGSPFIFSSEVSDSLEDVDLVVTPPPPADLTPMVINNPSDLPGLRPGQELTLQPGGEVRENFAVVGATMTNAGGDIDAQLEALNATIHQSSGTLGDGVALFEGAELNLTGGTVGDGLRVLGGAVVNNDGAAIGQGLEVDQGTVFNQRGGTIGAGFDLNGGVFNLYGGSISTEDDGFDGFGDEFNFFGTRFVLDGADITGTLDYGVATVINARNVPLEGDLLDGTSFAYDLSDNIADPTFFSNLLQVTVTLVSQLDGDYNNDGLVDAADYTLWRDNLGEPAGTLMNDPNDGPIGQAQYATWVAQYGQAAPALSVAVPEPSATLLITLFALGSINRRR